MKEAQASIKLDISQFEKPIETAKSKLASFAESIGKISIKIGAMVAAFVTIKNIVEYTNFAAKSIKYLEDIFGKSGRGMMGVLSDIKEKSKEAFTTFSESIKTIAQSSASGMEKLKSASAGFGNITKNIPQNFKNITLGISGTIAGFVLMARTFTIVGGAISLVATGISKGFSLLFGIIKGIASFVGSIFNVALGVLQSALKGVAVGVVALAGAMATLTAFISRGVVGIFSLADELKRVRDITGSSVPFIMSLQKAFKESGLSAEQVIPVLAEMNRSIVATNEKGQPSSRAIKALGLSVRELTALNPDERFKRIALAIAGVGDKGLQTAYAMDIFGRFGRNVLAVIADTTAVQNFGSNLDKASKTMAENTDRFARIATKLKSSGNLFRGFFTEIAGAVAPQIEYLIDMLGKGDFLTNLGAKIGGQLKYGLDVFVGAIKTGTIVDALKTALLIPIIYFQDYFKRVMGTVGEIFKTITKENKITILFTDIPAKSLVASLTTSLKDVFVSVSKLFAVVMIEQLRTPVAMLKVFLTDIATSFGKTLAQSLLDLALPRLKELAQIFGFKGIGDALGVAISNAKSALGIKEDNRTFSERVQQERQRAVTENPTNFGLGTFDENVKNVVNKTSVFSDAMADIVNVVKNSFANMEGMSDEAKLKLGSLFQKLGDLERIGAEEVRRGELSRAGATAGGVLPTTARPSEAVVSSLQKIGGGGGAFGGRDPVLLNSEKQTDIQQEIRTYVKELKEMAKKGGGMEVFGPTYAFTA